MTISEERVASLVDGIYEAALAPERWLGVLQGIGECINSPSASALWFDGAGTRLLRGHGWNVDPEVMDLYARHYVKICPRLRLSRHFNAGDCYDDRLLREREAAAHREYYAFMDACGHSLSRTLVAERTPGMRMGLTFYGPVYEDPGGVALRLLSALSPHVRRASHMTLRTAEVAERAEFGDALFEHSGPLMVIDGAARVLRLNARAEAVLALRDGLRLVKGHLQAATPADDARLLREVAAALANGAARRPPPEGFALVTRPSGRPAWAVSAVPLPARHESSLMQAGARALLSVAETVPRLSPARLQRGFGLSLAEAEVAAALAGGMSLEEIAEARRVSVGTVRAQVKAVFAKLDVSTQAQLVGRVAAACGTVAGPAARN